MMTRLTVFDKKNYGMKTHNNENRTERFDYIHLLVGNVLSFFMHAQDERNEIVVRSGDFKARSSPLHHLPMLVVQQS
jgi:hypothetical protein